MLCDDDDMLYDEPLFRLVLCLRRHRFLLQALRCFRERLFHVENSELPYTQTPWTSGSGGVAVDATAELTLMQYSDACDADEHVRPRIQPPQPHPSPSSFIPSTSLMSMHFVSAYGLVRCFMPPNFSFSHAKSCLSLSQASWFLYPPILRER
jgi:hypothetical protein